MFTKKVKQKKFGDHFKRHALLAVKTDGVKSESDRFEFGDCFKN